MINEAALRRKDFREAADSGILLWRQNFITFIPFFAVPLWICAFIPRIFLPANFVYLSWLIIWFLKPFFDRIILHIISIKFFEKDAGFNRLFSGLGKTLKKGLLGDLLWRRFSPFRCGMMPLRVLEQNKKSKKMFIQRKRNLEKGGIVFCYLLTIWGIAVEIALLIGGFMFFQIVNEIVFNGNIYLESFEEREIYLYAAWCLNYMLIESIYVCMGFCVYINSRIEIEGWDLEITFRNLAENYKNKSKYAVLFILIFTFLLLPAKGFSDDQIPVNNIPIESLQAILDSPDFGGYEDTWDIRPRNRNNERNENSQTFYFPGHIRELIANILRLLLIFIIAGLLIFLFIYFYRTKMKTTKSKNNYNVNFLRNINTTDPKLLLEKALRFHELGNTRLAWGYCTAAAIYSWSIYRDIIFLPNATENECAELVSLKTETPQAKEFSILIKHWINLAYAGRNPPDGSFEQAVTHCKLLKAEND
ncbi:MAG: hypothetical protein FWD24_03915 [Treponema sp.]|nr:hypothetical protein [Treponema sp.]